MSGPMATLQIALRQIGWQPQTPTEWMDTEGSKWIIKGDEDFHQIKQAVQDDSIKQLWNLAAKHNQGAGLEQGADMIQLKRTLNSMYIHDRHQEARMLKTAVCNGIWTQTLWARPRYTAAPVVSM